MYCLFDNQPNLSYFIFVLRGQYTKENVITIIKEHAFKVIILIKEQIQIRNVCSTWIVWI